MSNYMIMCPDCTEKETQRHEVMTCSHGCMDGIVCVRCKKVRGEHDSFWNCLNIAEPPK